MSELSEYISACVNGKRLDEVLDPAELAKLQRELAEPDMRPQPTDVTIEGWFRRIMLWGNIKIEHKDPENRERGGITKNQFFAILQDDNLLKMFGRFHIEEIAINKINVYRDYIGMDGKQYREEFVITIELKDELKKAFKPKGFWGWFN